ncbi:hypothetical protein, partial [Gordonia aichiensis]
GEFTEHESHLVAARVSPDQAEAIEQLSGDDFTWLRDIITTHRDETGSAVAERILSDWSQQVNHFVKVMPREYKKVLLAISEAEKSGKDVDEAIMEAARG